MIDIALKLIALCCLAVLFVEVFLAVLVRYFAAGIALKRRHEQNAFTGVKKIGAALFVAGFIALDWLGRQTIVPLRFLVWPKHELITDFLERVTANPQKEPTWRLALAVDWRVHKVESVHPTHFRRANKALDELRYRYDKGLF